MRNTLRPRLPQLPLELLRLCNVSSFLHISAFCTCFTDSAPKVIILSRQNVNFWVEHGSTPPPPPTPLRAPQTVQCLKLFACFGILHVFYRVRPKSDHSVEVEPQVLRESGLTPPPPPTPLSSSNSPCGCAASESLTGRRAPFEAHTLLTEGAYYVKVGANY